MAKTVRRRPAILGVGSVALSAALARPVHAKSYGPGVTDQEIKLGTSAPYSGPASGFGVYGNAQTAYFKMINEQGGINGRKINLISLDNAYNPPKTLEVTRQLVENENVLAIAGMLGTNPNTAVQKYLNTKKVPNLFLTSGGERFNDPKEYPWIVPLYPTYVAQGISFARYTLAKNPDAKIAVLYLNDDLGKDFLRGLQLGLGDKAKTMIVRAVSHELTDPTIETQIIDLKSTGADTLFQFTTPKFAAQGIRKVSELGWKPLQILASVAAGIGATLVPAGLERSIGILTARWEKTPTDSETINDADVKQYTAFAKQYMPSLNLDDNTAVPGYINAFMIAGVLKKCGDDLTRENILKQATSLKDVQAPMLLPGILLFNSPTDYGAFHAMQLARFDGKRWVTVSDMITTDNIKQG
jgi:ABC-type branched-subunit amino acid transport system substrate-binding protein